MYPILGCRRCGQETGSPNESNPIVDGLIPALGKLRVFKMLAYWVMTAPDTQSACLSEGSSRTCREHTRWQRGTPASASRQLPLCGKLGRLGWLRCRSGSTECDKDLTGTEKNNETSL